MVTKLAEAKIDANKRAAGGGRKFKLEADNKGLFFAELSLNILFSPSMATCIFNNINRDANPGVDDLDFKRTFHIS